MVGENLTDLGTSLNTKAWLLKQFASPGVTFMVFSALKDRRFLTVPIGKYLGQLVSFKAKNTNLEIENSLFSFIGSHLSVQLHRSYVGICFGRNLQLYFVPVVSDLFGNLVIVHTRHCNMRFWIIPRFLLRFYAH